MCTHFFGTPVCGCPLQGPSAALRLWAIENFHTWARGFHIMAHPLKQNILCWSPPLVSVIVGSFMEQKWLHLEANWSAILTPEWTGTLGSCPITSSTHEVDLSAGFCALSALLAWRPLLHIQRSLQTRGLLPAMLKSAGQSIYILEVRWYGKLWTLMSATKWEFWHQGMTVGCFGENCWCERVGPCKRLHEKLSPMGPQKNTLNSVLQTVEYRILIPYHQKIVESGGVNTDIRPSNGTRIWYLASLFICHVKQVTVHLSPCISIISLVLFSYHDQNIHHTYS